MGCVFVHGYMCELSVSILCDGIFVFFSRYVCVHICETCLFLLCESWDMFLFVCESYVIMCDLCCVFGYVHIWIGPTVFLFVSILCMSTRWLESQVGGSWVQEPGATRRDR